MSEGLHVSFIFVGARIFLGDIPLRLSFLLFRVSQGLLLDLYLELRSLMIVFEDRLIFEGISLLNLNVLLGKLSFLIIVIRMEQLWFLLGFLLVFTLIFRMMEFVEQVILTEVLIHLHII